MAMIGAAAIAVCVTVLWVEHNSDLTLPQPTGPFAVGRTIYDWIDDSSMDALAPAPGTKRELLVWIWYPAKPGAPVDDYMPAQLRAADRIPAIFRLLTRDPAKVHCHSLRDAAIADEQPSYPVLILRGGGSSPVVNYSTLAEDAASHGYFVLGLDAPYRTRVVAFPDGRVITRRPETNPELYSGPELTRLANRLQNAWTGDVSFVLDRLAQLHEPRFLGRLDLSRVGVFGHSFGGATAAQFCSVDSRCKAGIDIDGALFGSVIQVGLNKPFMFLLSEHGDFSSDAEVRQIEADIETVYNRLPADSRIRVIIRDASHFTFSDDGALLKSPLLRTVLQATGALGTDGRRQLAVTAYCVNQFFDAYVKGSSRLNISTRDYPEIAVYK